MSDPIKPGDLVQQIGTCCLNHPTLGMIGVVVWVKRKATGSPECCGAPQWTGLHAGCTATASGVPLSWLKKIPPFPELQDERHDEEITA